jgi:hypothetical protein
MSCDDGDMEKSPSNGTLKSRVFSGTKLVPVWTIAVSETVSPALKSA